MHFEHHICVSQTSKNAASNFWKVSGFLADAMRHNGRRAGRENMWLPHRFLQMVSQKRLFSLCLQLYIFVPIITNLMVDVVGGYYMWLIIKYLFISWHLIGDCQIIYIHWSCHGNREWIHRYYWSCWKEKVPQPGRTIYNWCNQSQSIISSGKRKEKFESVHSHVSVRWVCCGLFLLYHKVL